MVAAVGLAVGEIEDVAEDAADRRARRVQDTKRLASTAGMIRTSVAVATGRQRDGACSRQRERSQRTSSDGDTPRIGAVHKIHQRIKGLHG